MHERDQAERRRIAAHWYAHLQSPDIGPSDWAEFREWEQDALNAAAFRDIERALSAVDVSSLASPGYMPPAAAPRTRRLGLALAAAALPAAIGLMLLFGQGGNQTGPAPPAVYASALGEQRRVDLPDGSSALLNTSSRIELAYSSSERRVVLAAGQAFFEVAPGSRPFIVKAAGTQTQAMGTAFDIRVRKEGPEITLVEGRIEVTSDSRPGEAMSLQPGDRLRFVGGRAGVLDRVDPDRVLSWRSGVLQFTDTTLAEAAAEFNRYAVTQILIDGEALGAERLSGSFPADEPEQFVSAVTMFLPVRVIRSDDQIVISPAEAAIP